MLRLLTTFVLVLVVSPAPVLIAQPPAPTRYLTPPQALTDILDAAPLPTAALSPNRGVLALYERRAMPPLAELAAPMLRLAGIRLNPQTNGPHRQTLSSGLVLLRLADRRERRVALPASRPFVPLGFNPAGDTLALAMVGPDGVGLWLVNATDATARAVPGAERLNAGLRPPCEWQADGRALVCRLVDPGRGVVPTPPAVPEGPNVQEAAGRTAPVRTYQDLLTSAHDEALFAYYASSQVARITVADGRLEPIGTAGLVAASVPSPDGRYLLVTRLKRPFSRLVPWSSFPQDVEVWTSEGRLVRSVADVPLGDTVPITGVITGPRSVAWDPTQPARLVWVEALDGGDLKTRVPERDRLVVFEAPFTAEPRELGKVEHRVTSVKWTDAGTMLVTEFDRGPRRQRVAAFAPGGSRRVLWERSVEDAYAAPGRPVERLGTDTVLQDGSTIFLEGDGASPQGDRPFLDALDLTTLKRNRLFHCDDAHYEQVVALISDDGSRLLTRRESPTAPPNYYVRDLTPGGRTPAPQALTTFRDPAPALRGIQKRRLQYARPDGVTLSATLYLPPGYATGTRLPVLVWAYPQEFTTAAGASQVTGSLNRFTSITGASHLLLLLEGYAILDDPAMPIVGPGETANDTYVDQLVASAQAAVDHLVSLGIADRDRIGIGGHSYGAFMTANLLAHSDLFRMGIARSGAYNRTLTPFGFQAETRTFWEVPEVYARMSPFWHASRINEPILLIHGEMDNNSGTFPLQSERMFMALKGHGATARYVTLPYESHGYAARESVLHTVAEMVQWADRHLKAVPASSGQPD